MTTYSLNNKSLFVVVVLCAFAGGLFSYINFPREVVVVREVNVSKVVSKPVINYSCGNSYRLIEGINFKGLGYVDLYANRYFEKTLYIDYHESCHELVNLDYNHFCFGEPQTFWGWS